jgi:hypothetical protein
MGVDLYVLRPGESLAELERRESADHFGLRNKAMAELERVAAEAGIERITISHEESISPGEAAQIARGFRQYLSDLDGGRDVRDPEIRQIVEQFAGFCERAGRAGGYVCW